MKEFIRIDDFPHGDRGMYESQGDDKTFTAVTAALQTMENSGVRYAIGASPLLLSDRYLEFLKSMKNGMVLMHGFNHGFSYKGSWGGITSTWAGGGEFNGMSVQQIIDSYNCCDEILSSIPAYNQEHFIPPFNCFNQNLLDALKPTPVKYIHSCDQEWNGHNQSRMNFHDMTPIVSRLFHSYDYAHLVENRLDAILKDREQITLHWCYDVQMYGSIEGMCKAYESLAKALLNKSDEYRV